MTCRGALVIVSTSGVVRRRVRLSTAHNDGSTWEMLQEARVNASYCDGLSGGFDKRPRRGEAPHTNPRGLRDEKRSLRKEPQDASCVRTVYTLTGTYMPSFGRASTVATHTFWGY